MRENFSALNGRISGSGFLYEKDMIGTAQSTMITPFYFSLKKKDQNYQATLPPFIFWKYTNSHVEKRYSLLGLVGDVNYIHPDGVPDYDLGIFPLVLYGKSPRTDDRYLFVWPVGGSIRGKLALDYINPWVFPGVALFFLYPPSSLFYLPFYVAAALIPAYVSYGDAEYSGTRNTVAPYTMGKRAGTK